MHDGEAAPNSGVLQKCGLSSSEHIPSSPFTYVRTEEQGVILERVFKYSCLYVT